MEQADEETVILVCSDHGGTPNQFRAVDIEEVLEETGFIVKDKTGAIDWTQTRAVNVGLVHIFINLAGREPDGIVAPEDYEATQRELIAALHTYKDAKTGRHPFTLAVTRADAEMFNLHGDLVGDGRLCTSTGVRRCTRQAVTFSEFRDRWAALYIYFIGCWGAARDCLAAAGSRG